MEAYHNFVNCKRRDTDFKFKSRKCECQSTRCTRTSHGVKTALAKGPKAEIYVTKLTKTSFCVWLRRRKRIC